ncbi:MAG: acyl-CoA dehydrogenase family protein, partial [Actinobacteria bacterium]|nr:acyl-CoA dehydrogenase family protein [Actinomycetota bacterium]
MKATFTDEQRALADTMRGVAAGGRAGARALLDGRPPGEDISQTLFGGFAGVGIPEDAGGLGGGLVDLAILLEGLGHSVAPTPFVSHVLAVQAAFGAGIDVGGALDGEQRWALAVEEQGRPLSDPSAALDDGHLTGAKLAVRDGAGCTAAVATAAGGLLAVAEPTDRTERPALDRTRPLADL